MADQEFFLNMRSGILHRYPAFESCNLDAIHNYNRVVFIIGPDLPYEKVRWHEAYRRDCERCKP